MKVVHILFSNQGGAYRAAERISEALRRQGIDSCIMLIEKNEKSDDKCLICNIHEKILYKVKRKLDYVVSKNKKNNSIYIAKWGYDLLRNPEIRDADIINIHWIGYHVISEKQLLKLAKKKNVIWTLHDMWPFTGGCFYSGQCRDYLTGCQKCCLARTEKECIQIKNSWKFKKKLYATKIGVIGCSTWILNEARKGMNLDDNYIRVIHNPIDTLVFDYTPSDFRKKYDINDQTKIIAFGADRSNKNTRKGMKELIESLRKLKTKDVCCVMFGNDGDEIPQIGCRSVLLGLINDDKILASIFSASDVVVVPSLQENLSNVVLESLSCGTPVVAFDIGGMSDMIQDGINGALVPPYDVDILAEKIDKCIGRNYSRKDIKKTVYKKFNPEEIARQYIEFYNDMIEQLH